MIRLPKTAILPRVAGGLSLDFIAVDCAKRKLIWRGFRHAGWAPAPGLAISVQKKDVRDETCPRSPEIDGIGHARTRFVCPAREFSYPATCLRRAFEEIREIRLAA